MQDGRVNFFIAGVQKGGTTAIDSMLRQHPRIQMAKVKEVHYFDNSNVDWFARQIDVSPLHDQFDWNLPHILRGEATPIYTFWQPAIRRLHQYNPTARLIVGLRHPAYRAYSHWRMEVTRKAETLDFYDAITHGTERTIGQAEQHRVYSYVERGYYDIQIKRLKELFPTSQLHFFRTDALWTQPHIELERIEKFLSVERILSPQQDYIVPLQSALLPPMSAYARRYLGAVYEQTVANLSDLTGLSFEDWKDPDYVEPMRPS